MAAVFAVMLFTMLLGMIMNVGRQVDGKIRIQNAADAAAYSGGLMLARGMNTLAFTNHLLCDVFATTAFLREARDRHSESSVPPILDAWDKEGTVFIGAEFPKFQELGPAIRKKTQLEQRLVTRYCDWAEAAAQCILPLMESILAEEMIPQYQQAVVAAFPGLAQTAAMEVTIRNGEPALGRGKMLGVLWRSSGALVGGDSEWVDPTLPAVDPREDTLLFGSSAMSRARRQREEYARHYLNLWNHWTMLFFEREAKMCQFGGLWRSFTCGQLNKLLNEEYPNRNLPILIRAEDSNSPNADAQKEEHFTFLGTVYWNKASELMPGVYRNPLAHDGVAFAEVRVFIPRGRLEWHYPEPWPHQFGGVPGEFPDMPEDSEWPKVQWIIRRHPVPRQWDLWNQNWTCQLVPVTLPALTTILRTTPPLPAFAETQFSLPEFGDLSTEEIARISPH